MTPLPQRKKTDEEIAKLREEIGVPAAVPITTKMETEMDPSHPAQRRPTKPKTTQFRKIIQSERGNEQKPPHRFQSFSEGGAQGKHAERAIQVLEQDELSSRLPQRRRSAQELEEIRRREMLNQLNEPPAPNIKFMPCHPAGITAGYLLAAVGSVGFWVESYPWSATLAGSLLALLVAGFIALRRPVSRHHAGFISATAALVAIFTAIHHFLHI